MQITDPIADMLTRIRNAGAARHATVDVPASRMKKAIAQILLDEGYIKAFEVTDEGVQGNIKITLKYTNNKEKAISAFFQRIGMLPVTEIGSMPPLRGAAPSTILRRREASNKLFTRTPS